MLKIKIIKIILYFSIIFLPRRMKNEMETQETTFCNDSMDPSDKLLKLIEEGDADTILSEENMQNSFSELIKYELIVIKNDKVFLTELGTVARIVGVQKIVNELKEKKIAVKTAAPVADPKDIRISYLSYYILLIVGLLMMLFIQIAWN